LRSGSDDEREGEGKRSPTHMRRYRLGILGPYRARKASRAAKGGAESGWRARRRREPARGNLVRAIAPGGKGDGTACGGKGVTKRVNRASQASQSRQVDGHRVGESEQPPPPKVGLGGFVRRDRSRK
jgi:hypothetical protein